MKHYTQVCPTLHNETLHSGLSYSSGYKVFTCQATGFFIGTGVNRALVMTIDVVWTIVFYLIVHGICL